MQGLADQDAAVILEIVNGLAQQGIDFTAVLAELVSVLHKLALAQAAPDADKGSSDHETVLGLAQAISAEDVQLYYQIGLIGRRDLPMAPDLRSGFEMILLRMLAFRPDGAATQASTPASAQRAPVAPRAAPTQVRQPAVAPVATAQAAAPTAVAGPAAAAAVTPVAAADRAWHEVVEQLGLNGMVYQLAANSTLEAKEGGVVRLAQSAKNTVMRSRSIEQRLQDALQTYYGEPIRLEFVAAEASEFTPAARQQKAAEDRQQAAVEAINADPNVQKIQEVFDAQVVPDSVRPVDS